MISSQTNLLKRVLIGNKPAASEIDFHYQLMNNALKRRESPVGIHKLSATAHFINTHFNSHVEGFVSFPRLEETQENIDIFKSALQKDPTLANAKNLYGSTALVEAAVRRRHAYSRIIVEACKANRREEPTVQALSIEKQKELLEQQFNAINSLIAVFATAMEYRALPLTTTTLFDNPEHLKKASTYRLQLANSFLHNGIDFRDKTLFEGLHDSERAERACHASPSIVYTSLSAYALQELCQERVTRVSGWLAEDYFSQKISMPEKMLGIKRDTPTKNTSPLDAKAIKSQFIVSHIEAERCNPFKQEYLDSYNDVDMFELLWLSMIAETGGIFKSLPAIRFMLAQDKYKRAEIAASMHKVDVSQVTSDHIKEPVDVEGVKAPLSHSVFTLNSKVLHKMLTEELSETKKPMNSR